MVLKRYIELLVRIYDTLGEVFVHKNRVTGKAMIRFAVLCTCERDFSLPRRYDMHKCNIVDIFG